MYEVDCFNLSASCQDKSIKGKKLGLQICPRPGTGPSFPWAKGEARRNFWWFLWRGGDRGGTHRQSQLWLSCTLNSQPVTRRIVGSLECIIEAKYLPNFVRFADKVENKYLKRVYALFPGHERQVSVTERRRVSHSVKESSPSVTHLSRSRDNIVRTC